jgi:Fur family ferric uptake transcriptional regulator
MSTAGPPAPPETRDAPEPRAGPAWESVRDRLRARGLRWTPQRRILVDVLHGTHGHVTGAELIERCRAVDPSTIASTVYRTLDVLEELGFIRHGHGPDGREEFHVLPSEEHGHLHCAGCGRAWEIGPGEAAALIEPFERSRGFAIDLSHLSIVGRCATCRAADADPPAPADGSG